MRWKKDQDGLADLALLPLDGEVGEKMMKRKEHIWEKDLLEEVDLKIKRKDFMRLVKVLVPTKNEILVDDTKEENKI